MSVLHGRGLRSRFPRLARMFDRLSGSRSARLRLCRGERMDLWVDPLDEGIGRPLLAGTPYEPVETAVVEALLSPGDTFIDIGANVGYFSILARQQVGDAGRVIAFEPDPDNASLLRRNLQTNAIDGVEIHPVALSDRRGSIEFYKDLVSHGSHSLFRSSNSARAIRVPTETLDAILTPAIVPDFVKIDVEGAESLVIAGARETLARCRDRVIVLIEVMPAALERGGSDAEQVFSLLEEAGLTTLGLDGEEIDAAGARERAASFGCTNVLATARTDVAERVRAAHASLPAELTAEPSTH